MVNLIRKVNEWVVVYLHKAETKNERFENIELAAEFMNKLGISDDDIDSALCDLYAHEHVRALFNGEGEFSHTEVT